MTTVRVAYRTTTSSSNGLTSTSLSSQAHSSRMNRLARKSHFRKTFCTTTSLRSGDQYSEERALSKEERLAKDMRNIMRASAQPVTVITSFLAPNSSSSSFNESTKHSSSNLVVHGATVSSFTTISLDPPVVAFNMQKPSRLADALLHPVRQRNGEAKNAHFVINILNETQADLALQFSKPGLVPPLELPCSWPKDENISSGAPEDHPFVTNRVHPSICARASSSEDGSPVPVLNDVVGAFACSILTSMDAPWNQSHQRQSSPSSSSSILFLARVHAVESLYNSRNPAFPLVYWNGSFTGVKR